MKTFISLGLAASFTGLSFAQDSSDSATAHSENGVSIIKRDFLTCEETYGGGSITCGDSTSRYCYDPTLGETCCSLDDGYCKAGDFCAPVAGYCCQNGESITTCAARLFFTLPFSSTILPSLPSAAATTILAEDDFAASSTTIITSLPTSTIEIILTDTSSSPLPVVVDGFVTSAAGTVTTTGSMTPDFTALASANSSVPAVGNGVVDSTTTTAATLAQFTGAAVKMGPLYGLVGAAAVVGLVL